MTSRAEKYASAAKAYEQVGAVVASDMISKLSCQELLSFMESEEWSTALKMLKYSGERIILSRAPDVTLGGTNTTQYVLTGLGFYEITCDKFGRWSEKEFLKDVVFASPEKQMTLVSSFRKYQGNSLLVEFILNQLDRIADECPKL